MTLATIAEADAEYARNVGIANPERAWILSDRDVWYPNPAYTGPRVPHPEEDYPTDEELAALEQAQAERDHDASASIDEEFLRGIGPADADDDIPF